MPMPNRMLMLMSMLSQRLGMRCKYFANTLMPLPPFIYRYVHIHIPTLECSEAPIATAPAAAAALRECRLRLQDNPDVADGVADGDRTAATVLAAAKCTSPLVKGAWVLLISKPCITSKALSCCPTPAPPSQPRTYHFAPHVVSLAPPEQACAAAFADVVRSVETVG
jgi:hypothetical protein